MMPPKVTEPRKHAVAGSNPGRVRTAEADADPWGAAWRSVLRWPAIACVLGDARVGTQVHLGVPFVLQKGGVLLARELVETRDPEPLAMQRAAQLLRHALEARLWATYLAASAPLAEHLAVALLCCRVSHAFAQTHGLDTIAPSNGCSWLGELIVCLSKDHPPEAALLAPILQEHGASLLRMHGVQLRSLTSAACSHQLSRADILSLALGRVADMWDLAAPTGALVLTGGDSRLRLQGPDALNMYGAAPVPRDEARQFASCTASTPSRGAFAHMEAMRQRLTTAAWQTDCKQARRCHADNVRTRLAEACGFPVAAVHLLPSGTDAELVATQCALRGHDQELVNVVVGPLETGSGVPLAAAGRYFDKAEHEGPRAYGAPVDAAAAKRVSVANVPIRAACGRLRALDDVDRDVVALMQRAVRQGKRALVHVLDVSKTGVRTPSIRCITALRQRYGEAVTVLVDAAQWRLTRQTLAQYHTAGLWLVLTGSKFLGGAPFSGALILPPQDAVDVPTPSVGLLLRWESALHELAEFARVPTAATMQALRRFHASVHAAIACRDNLEPLPDDGATDTASPCIHAFTVRWRGAWLDLSALKAVHRWLYSDISEALPKLSPAERTLAALVCHVGQPVVVAEASARVALRIAPSARTVSAMAQGHDIAPEVETVFAKLDLICANLEVLRAHSQALGALP